MAKVTFNGIGIENLGPFRERQYLDLHVGSNRPIVLIKALNGSGKTTLLSCLQVVLYGSRALPAGRNGEYEQLIRGLQRVDACGVSRIELDLRIETGGDIEDLRITREWSPTASRVNEVLTVARDGSADPRLTEDWPERIDSILPSELLQLFLFDGEKIEALANPKNLPEMLRRATEAFLGIGGIDSLAKDLVAVERRALLHSRSADADYNRAREELTTLQAELARVSETIDLAAQKSASAKEKLDHARNEYAQFETQSRRRGLSSFEQAADIRARETVVRKELELAKQEVREALADPYLPLAHLSELWKNYEELRASEAESKTAKVLLGEMKKRDQRVLQSLRADVGAEELSALATAMAKDNQRYSAAARQPCVLQEAPNPAEVLPLIRNASKRHAAAAQQLARMQQELAQIERQIAAIPSREQLADTVEKLRKLAEDIARAEAELDLLEGTLEEQKSRAIHLESRVNAAAARMSVDFRGKEQDAKAIQAAQRTRAVLANFKEELLASKATWLSEMITTEFKSLLRKQRLVEKVLVEPDTYVVSIVGKRGEYLPMERLSAGERQLLAIAVLSALIRERKGLFPVVVDTPLARLDRTHRQSLIQRFFSKVSHQVLVLSTDEEVEGVVLDAMRRFTSSAYLLQFSDDERRSSVDPLMLEAA